MYEFSITTEKKSFNIDLSWVIVGRDSSVDIATAYGLDGLGSNPGAGEIFCTCPDRPWGPPSLLYNGYWVFPGVKSGWGVTLSSQALLVPWSWKGRAIPLLPLWAIRPVQSLNACTRVHFTFTFYHEWLQASTTLSMWSVLFWDFMHCRTLILYRHFRTIYQSIYVDLTCQYKITNLHFMKFQKSEIS